MTQNAVVRWSAPKVILVATDFLEGHRMMLHAIYQAKLSRAKVLLVHVVPQPGGLMAAQMEIPPVLPGLLLASVNENMSEFVRAFRQEGIECEPVVLTGHPGEQISLLAKSRAVDRVVVSTRNTNGIARLKEESVAEELIAALDIPVCVIGRRTHQGADCSTPPGRILLATSFAPGSALLARFACTLAEVNHSQLALLHVLDTTGMKDQQRELARFTARIRLHELVPKVARHRKAPVYLVREGDPAAIILAEAGSMSEDLVILGSSYPSIISWLLGSSVVHRVVIESECPVITVKLQADSNSQNNSVDADVTLVPAGSSTKTSNVSN
jgi:nucleotide-binding universal stress UspA family protein